MKKLRGVALNIAKPAEENNSVVGGAFGRVELFASGQSVSAGFES